MTLQPMIALSLASLLLLSACAQVCDQSDPAALKACQDREFANFQQQLQDNRPPNGGGRR